MLTLLILTLDTISCKTCHSSNLHLLYHANTVGKIFPLRKMFFYKLGDTELEYVQEEKDLGVIVSSNFIWDRQVDALLSKASSRLGLLKRTIHFIRCQKQRRAFYLAIVRSQFEHCSQVWRPSSETQINKLERIQRRAVKWILSGEDHSYNDTIEYLMRLRDLDLFPLRERFTISDLIVFFDIFRGQSCLELPSYIKYLSLEERSRLRPKIKPPQNINSVENSQHLNRLRQSRNDSQSLKSEINAKAILSRQVSSTELCKFGIVSQVRLKKLQSYLAITRLAITRTSL